VWRFWRFCTSFGVDLVQFVVPDPTVRTSEAFTDLGRVLMQKLKLRTYPLLIAAAGLLASTGGIIKMR